MGIDIGADWFRIANGLMFLLTMELWPLTDVKMSFFLNRFRTNRRIWIQCCICIDIYKIRIGTLTSYFSLIFDRVMTLNFQHRYDPEFMLNIL